ncbi:phosphate/phosphite/phosphonate ABC transporter substrate-binding protein [Obesumbacterium proteus]|uniref:phosphate/phosphite/phosphonate ABC transporter substrate-binding protein n=2 Tax=Obesumbacterium proteus TaxID=82983 RepID=UPI001EDC9071|nr:PhnD/SsuA/transferrin family substrate-binding protein [Obesumbacterium proteus]
MRVSLPMYGINRDDVELLWQGLSRWLAQEGEADLPPHLCWPDDLYAHWQQPDLLLSQTCGYPLQETLSAKVDVVGVFRYRAPGCEGNDYRSFLVARKQDAGADIGSFLGRKAAYNSEDSQSGYNALRSVIVPLAHHGRFFASTLQTGSHRASLLAIKQGDADIAAIDCVTLALLQKAEPQCLSGLKIIGETPPAPGLPLITAAGNETRLLRLRRALKKMVEDPSMAAVRSRLLISGFSPISVDEYQRCSDMKLRAAALGVTRL